MDYAVKNKVTVITEQKICHLPLFVLNAFKSHSFISLG